MYYTLKEENPFYGRKGTMITDAVYNRIPEKHRKLFEMHNSDKLKRKVYSSIKLDDFQRLEGTPLDRVNVFQAENENLNLNGFNIEENIDDFDEEDEYYEDDDYYDENEEF